MRIIAGEYGGRVIQQPKTRATRPMSEKVRGALFDILGTMRDHSVLDAYAGSGAIGLEAISRGASQVVAIESGREAIRTIRANVQALEISWGYQLAESTVETWLARQSETLPEFSLIIADPPYRHIEPDILTRLGGYLQPAGTFVLSHDSKLTAPDLGEWKLAQTKTYGDSSLSFYTFQKL